jgi:hypothetical protein
MQALYTANILLIIAVGLAKLSVLQLLRHLAVEKIHQKAMDCALWVVMAWTVTSFFPLAFQCGAVQPWNVETGQCINRVRFS